MEIKALYDAYETNIGSNRNDGRFLKHQKEQKKQKVPFIPFIPMLKKYHGTRFSFLLM